MLNLNSSLIIGTGQLRDILQHFNPLPHPIPKQLLSQNPRHLSNALIIFLNGLDF
jgi:hypothetical protein